MTASSIDAAVRARDRGMHLVDYLRSRGYVQDISDEAGLRERSIARSSPATSGFDPTAASLHVGHLLSIMVLGTLQRFGHRPIALAGGGTTMVGDPTGKTATRQVLTPEEIQAQPADSHQAVRPLHRLQGRPVRRSQSGRAAGQQRRLAAPAQVHRVPARHRPPLLGQRDAGRRNVQAAAGTTGLNFVEFNYRIVQAYDFLHLYRAVRLQAADGRLRPVGQYRGRRRSDPPG